MQRPRTVGGSIAKEEVDRAFVHSMAHTSVNELLMRDGALRDTYSSLMDTNDHRPKSFIEKVRSKAREEDGSVHIDPKDSSWLVHKYMEDLKVSRQVCFPFFLIILPPTHPLWLPV